MNRFFRGALYQRGYGIGGNFYKSRRGYGIGHYGSYQKGTGLGRMWGSFIKWISPLVSKVKDYAMPILKTGSKVVGKEVINAASDIANAVLEGKNLKDTASERISQGIDNLMSDKKQMSGEGLPTINKKRKRIFGSLVSRSKKRKPRVLDIFDL